MMNKSINPWQSYLTATVGDCMELTNISNETAVVDDVALAFTQVGKSKLEQSRQIYRVAPFTLTLTSKK